MLKNFKLAKVVGSSRHEDERSPSTLSPSKANFISYALNLIFYHLGGPRPARKRRSDSDNVFDDAESLYSTRGVLEVRLSDDPNTAFRQIKTGAHFQGFSFRNIFENKKITTFIRL